jgi:predicted nucleic acid-binding protein
MKIFVDSDVIISSLLSESGAAFHLLNQEVKLDFFVSNLSVIELEEVAKRLGIDLKKLKSLIEKRFSITRLEKVDKIRKNFANYVFDINDAHIVAGAKASEARFLISYNVKDYKIERIKEDLDIIILTPGQFLQYLRSLK